MLSRKRESSAFERTSLPYEKLTNAPSVMRIRGKSRDLKASTVKKRSGLSLFQSVGHMDGIASCVTCGQIDDQGRSGSAAGQLRSIRLQYRFVWFSCLSLCEHRFLHAALWQCK
jgi:hypothetical protein